MSDTTDNKSKVLPGTCNECEADRRRLQQVIRQLTEKLEHSQLQNTLLNLECDRLRKELNEAEFRGRSSVVASSPPSLPTELLRHIFSLATHMDGLAFPRWHEADGNDWEMSSLARKAIPLVCRAWYAVGLEFLFEHIAIESTSQINKLLDTLNLLSRDDREHRASWIRGLECVMSHERGDRLEHSHLVYQLVGMLPERNLSKFGVHANECPLLDPGLNIDNMLGSQLSSKLSTTLKAFHIPCVRYSKFINENFSPHTLSLTGYQNSCSCTNFHGATWTFEGPDKTSPNRIETLLVNCMSVQRDISPFYAFLESADHLDAIHIVTGFDHGIMGRFDQFLTKVPKLKRLSITLMDRPILRNIPAPVMSEFSHPPLEEVVIHLKKWKTYVAIDALKPLMNKVRDGDLPSLQRIIIHVDFPGGCLDSGRMLEKPEYNLWVDAIEWCAEREVALVNHQGYPIHLWHVQHGIRLEESEIGTTCAEEEDDDDDDDDEWFERSDTTSFYGSEHEDTENIISDDSEDTPYRYVSRPDIEQVDPDSEDEGED